MCANCIPLTKSQSHPLVSVQNKRNALPCVPTSMSSDLRDVLEVQRRNAPPSHKLAHKSAGPQARLMKPNWSVSAGRHSGACGPAPLYAWLWECAAPPPMDFKRAEPFDPS